MKQNLDVKIYNTFIPRNVRLAEAPSYGMPINLYDQRSKGAKSYMELAEEIISGEASAQEGKEDIKEEGSDSAESEKPEK